MRQTSQTTGKAAARPGPAKLTAAELRLIGRFDHVTRLPNRLEFIKNFKRLRGRKGLARTLVLITLADARHYNDILRALGHAFSEEFVRAGLARLRELTPRGTEIYHVSVLSFAFVIEHDCATGMPPLADAIASAFSGNISVEGIPIVARVGVGLMPLDGVGLDAAEVLRASLVAAQDSRASDAGIAFYNNRSDAAHQRAFRILADLPSALSRSGQLSLALQPRIDLKTGRARGAEALLRWRHPELGMIPPGEFIPLAEQTALIHPLTDWVMDEAMATTRALLDRGHDLTVSINASPLNLSEAGFDDKLLWLCDGHGLAPHNVEIEFTEGTLAANPERAARQLQRIRAIGIEIAIDDFGTGFSNLSNLQRLPADVLKIDQSFIRPIVAGDDFIVRQIIAIAKGLDLRVCAEGIETAETYALLQNLGCDEGQGYFMARPMPAADFQSWLEAENRLAI